MNIDVAKAIQELLFEQPAVIIPGLGGFTSTSKASTVDYVQGVVTPPAKKLEFNTNLVINDGMLVGHIQRTKAVTSQQAKEAVDAFVEEIKAALERREIVDLPHIGRLYKDYEHKIRFMPEGTNFEADSFGLPAVKFQPVVRERPAAATGAGTTTVAAAAAAAAATKTTPPPPPQAPPTTAAASQAPWINKLWPVLIIAAAVLVALSIFFFFRGSDDPTTADTGVNQERLNVPPGQNETTTAPSSSDRPTDEAPAQRNPPPSEDNPGQVETTPPPATDEPAAAPPSSSGQTSFIVIHSFGVRANARKFERRLETAGYQAYSKKEGGVYRVGVLYEHETDRELQTMIDRLGRKYDSTPKVRQQ